MILWGVALAVRATLGATGGQVPVTPIRDGPQEQVREEQARDSMVARFYDRRALRLAWTDSGVVSTPARELLDALTRAADDGLDPSAYSVFAIDSLIRLGPPPESLWRLDSLLTLGFLTYGSDLSQGRVSPEAVDTQWAAAAHPMDLVRLLETAIASGHVTGALRGLAPPHPGYVGLRRSLVRYRAMAARGSWPPVPPGALLRPAARGTRVARLRSRLGAEGYFAAGSDSGGDRYDGGLEAAVRRFQQLHGLEEDGIVGPSTLAALNIPGAVRVRQIELNLERWRWLPRSLGDRYIMVNSAAFTLDVVDRGRPVFAMRAIVGRPDWPTPIVSSRITDLLFRPLWNVPRAIASEELLPIVQRDAGYLGREGIRVFRDSTAGGQEIDASVIDWATVTESTLAYQFVQEPGPDNPLGGLKFVFWTRFNVFIHDTPVRTLFAEPLRRFSHGCVRIEHAVDLAAYLLPDWSADSIQSAMTQGRERWVRLPASVPVHLVYWTAWSEDDMVQFRDDTYGWDERLATALDRRQWLGSSYTPRP